MQSAVIMVVEHNLLSTWFYRHDTHDQGWEEKRRWATILGADFQARSARRLLALLLLFTFDMSGHKKK